MTNLFALAMSRYEQFAKTVATILQAAIKASPQHFRLQQIKTRAKNPKSLKRKLVERGLTEFRTSRMS